MKSLKIKIILLSMTVGILGCNQSSNENEATMEYTTEIPSADILDMENVDSAASEDSVLSSSAATYQDEKREFVRKADVSMEVKDVYKSTTKIETKISELGGFVEESLLNSHIQSKEIYAVNSDSAMQVKKYSLHNQMRVRIPQENLGEFLTSLGEEIEFLNYRNISAEDVRLNLEWAKLEQKRLNHSNQQLINLNHQKGKIGDKKEVIGTIGSNTSQSNHQKIASLNLKDEVNFSIIQLEFTEKDKIAESMIVNPQSYDDKYHPDFLYSLGVSIKGGFTLFKNLLIAMAYIWPLWLIGLLALLFFRIYKTNKKLI